jgi:hypothetical protein
VFAGTELIHSQAGIAGLKARLTGPNEDQIVAEIASLARPA